MQLILTETDIQFRLQDGRQHPSSGTAIQENYDQKSGIKDLRGSDNSTPEPDKIAVVTSREKCSYSTQEKVSWPLPGQLTGMPSDKILLLITPKHKGLMKRLPEKFIEPELLSVTPSGKPGEFDVPSAPAGIAVLHFLSC
jgi:hypothetical protein